MLVEIEQQIELLRQVKLGNIKEGLKLDIPEIDEYFRFKPTNLNFILGHANVGKTSVIMYLMLCYSKKYDLKWLVYTSENETYGVIRRLVEYLCEKPIQHIDDFDFNYQVGWINDHFKFVATDRIYTYKQLLDLGKAVKEAWDYDGVLLDPYNSIAKDSQVLKSVGGNSHDYDYYATSEMRIFCKVNKVAMWICGHPSTESIRKVHRDGHFYAGHPVPPNSSDIEGGGKFVNRCDDFMVIHRYIYHAADYMKTQIYMRKVKEIETGGRPNSIDSPIEMRAMKNNVGYEIGGKSILKLIEEQKAPF
jgi:hypothetical protein